MQLFVAHFCSLTVAVLSLHLCDEPQLLVVGGERRRT